MSLTDPEQYNPHPEDDAVREEDVDNTLYQSTRRFTVKYIHPVMQRLFNNHPWIEIITLVLVILTFFMEMFSSVSTTWYALVYLFSVVFFLKQIMSLKSHE